MGLPGLTRVQGDKRYSRRRTEALRILQGDALIRVNAIPALSVETPTITTGLGETFGNGITGFTSIPWTDSRFRYNHAQIADSAVVTGDGKVSSAIARNGARATTPNFASSNPVQIEFQWTGTQFAFGTFLPSSAGAGYRIWVDGKPLTTGMTALPTGNADRQVRVVFGTRATRLITIEGEVGFRFRGLAIEPTALVVASPNRRGPKMGCLTDSYGEASTGITWRINGYLPQAAALNGWELDMTECVGSTGYTANSGGAGGRLTYADPARLASLIAGAPDIVYIQGSRNDNPNVGTGAITTAATTVFTTIRAALPNAWIIVTGPLYMETPPGTATTNQNEIRAAYDSVFGTPGVIDADKRVMFIDTLTPMIAGGTGNIGTRTVTDGVLNSTTTLTSATAAFVAGDVGSYITGTGIPALTKIASRTNATTVVLSAAATATASGVSVTVTNQKGDGPADFLFAADITHPSLEGHKALTQWLAAQIAGLLVRLGLI